MNSKTTYDILKYGPMFPDKVRSIIDVYLEDSRSGYWKSEWKEIIIKDTSDSKFMETHFFKVWVYFDTTGEATIIAIVPRYLVTPLTRNNWVQVSQGVIAIDVTNINKDDVYIKFHEYYEELTQLCLMAEYKENYPGDIE